MFKGVFCFVLRPLPPSSRTPTPHPVCSHGPDNLVTPLSSGGAVSLSPPPHPRSPEPPLRATSGAREIPPTPALTTNTEPHRHFETAADGGPFLDVSLKNHLRQHLYSAPSPPVSHPYLGRRATLINIHHPPEWRRRWVGGWLDGSGGWGGEGGECEDALPSVPLHPLSTKGPQANGVHPRQPPRRDHRAADEIIKAALGLKAGPIIPHHRNHPPQQAFTPNLGRPRRAVAGRPLHIHTAGRRHTASEGCRLPRASRLSPLACLVLVQLHNLLIGTLVFGPC